MTVAPFHVTYEDVSDERLSALLEATNAAGFATPSMSPARPDIPASPSTLATLPPVDVEDFLDLPDEWRFLKELSDQSFRWPNSVDEFFDYRVYAGDTSRNGTVHIALGKAERQKTWGRDRTYIIAFLTSGTPQNALVEFLETDDRETTDEFVAVIRGKDGARSKKMYGLGDSLPNVYTECFRTVTYSDHIRFSGAWSKMAVLAKEDDHATMLNHALVQARRRGDV